MLHLQKGVFTFQTAFGQPLPSCAPRAAAFLLSTISFARTLDPQRAPHRRTSVPDASSSAPAQEPNASPFGCSLQPSTQRLRSLTPQSTGGSDLFRISSPRVVYGAIVQPRFICFPAWRISFNESIFRPYCQCASSLTVEYSRKAINGYTYGGQRF